MSKQSMATDLPAPTGFELGACKLGFRVWGLGFGVWGLGFRV